MEAATLFDGGCQPVLHRYAQLSVRMMEALHLARPLARPKERRGLNVAMQACNAYVGLQPPSHRVTASITQGCSFRHIG